MTESPNRREQILDAAQKLFAIHGFEATTIQQIQQEVGIARGTLYYHFPSKEDILDALVDRMGARVLAKAQAVAQDRSIPVPERAIKTALALNISQEGYQEVLDQMHKPSNVLMHEKASQLMLKDIPPILAGIVEEGIAQGLFDTPCALFCMEMMVAYTVTVLDGNVPWLTQEDKQQRIGCLLLTLERMLGAREGTFLSALSAFGG